MRRGSTDAPPWVPVGADGRARSARLPLIPKLYADETLHSFIERLAAEYGMAPSTLADWLGFGDPWRKASVPDVATPNQLLIRWGTLTGVPVARFHAAIFPRTAAPSAFADRSGFCPRCWAGRRRLQAAYLSRAWAFPWTFSCERHGTLLCDRAQADDEGGWPTWAACFADRKRWAPLARAAHPRVWTEACVRFDLEPVREWPLSRAWIAALATAHRRAQAGRVTVAFLMVSDLLNYVQTNWLDYRKERRLRRPWPLEAQPRDPYSTDVCLDRRLTGTHGARLAALVLVRQLWRVMRGGELASQPLRDILEDFQRSHRSAFEDWWLTRRLMQWPSPWRERGFALFGLGASDAWVSIWEDRCRRCLTSAQPRLAQHGLSHLITATWRCAHDTWGLVTAERSSGRPSEVRAF